MGLYRDQARILVDLFHNTSTISGTLKNRILNSFKK